MAQKTYLVLEDGSVHVGEAFGAVTSTYGEVVFNTSMTGYQEVLTDPSYAGQIVTLTYPLVGNYGIDPAVVESKTVQVAGLVVREHCRTPSHSASVSTLDEYLASIGIPGICGVDTRSITRRLRSSGVMMGLISPRPPEDSLDKLAKAPRYNDTDFVRTVTTQEEYRLDRLKGEGDAHCRIVVVDYGVKYNILRLLRKLGCEVIVVPASSTSKHILSLEPRGVVFSPGPGDPALLGYAVDTAHQLLGKLPVLGICLGHQIVARALGAATFKLKFGHRGANHPVKDLATGRVYITAQNHGYAVDADSVKGGLEVSQINLNDNTVEGLRHRDLPLLTIQYHSEASPGPRDNEYIFDEFLDIVREVHP
jgi:carbamoyl-phosphate synthase small subunit